MLIELKKICVGYDAKTLVLNNLTLGISKGEFIVLLGKSGSGKSTLLKVIDGLLVPASGQVLFNGVDVYSIKTEKRKEVCTQKIGFIWQDYRLISENTVKQNIILPALINGVDYDKDFLIKIINFLEINKYMDQYPNKLSGGEQQRVAMARALILKPELILADEPTGALDSETSSNVINLFKKTHEELGTTFIIATHDKEISRVGTRTVELKDGKVV